MNLVFSSDGSTSELISWAKQFKEITVSTLIEIDLAKQEFICKVATEDRGLVRYSSISFEKCGLKYESCTDNNGQNEIPSSRIMCGIFLILQKFITTLEVFNGVPHTISVLFNLNSETQVYECNRFVLQSKTLKMSIPCQNVSDFKEISDDIFYNRIYTVSDPISVNVTTDFIKNLMGVSSIFSTDINQDIMHFYTRYDANEKKWMMCVKDKNNNDFYDYVIGYLNEDVAEDGFNQPIEMHIFRSKFAMAVAKSPANVVLMADKVGANRILIETEDGTTKTVISISRS